MKKTCSSHFYIFYKFYNSNYKEARFITKLLKDSPTGLKTYISKLNFAIELLDLSQNEKVDSIAKWLFVQNQMI